MAIKRVWHRLAEDDAIDDDGIRALAGAAGDDRAELCAHAARVRDDHWGRTLTYSPKVFVALTNLCRDRCAYCTYRRDPGDPGARTLWPDEVAALVARGRAAGCREALVCLGDRPEARYPSYRADLAARGFGSTVDAIADACRAALAAGLLPHTNAGILTRAELVALKPCNASMGLMLESTSARLRGPGEVHAEAPTKAPRARLKMIATAGALQIPFTTGILVGIGETAAERVEALLAIRRLHQRHQHIQECIVQPLVPKPGTPAAARPACTTAELVHAIALARTILPPDVSVQAPPNLIADVGAVIGAGINDWGGISPVTLDFINPERPWPAIDALAAACARAGFALAPRLAIYPRYLERAGFCPDPVRSLARAAA